MDLQKAPGENRSDTCPLCGAVGPCGRIEPAALRREIESFPVWALAWIRLVWRVWLRLNKAAASSGCVRNDLAMIGDLIRDKRAQRRRDAPPGRENGAA